MNWPDPSAPKPSWVKWAESAREHPDADLKTDDFPDVMTSDDAALYLGCAASTVRRRVRTGELKVIRKGRRGTHHLFSKNDLNDYLGQREGQVTDVKIKP